MINIDSATQIDREAGARVRARDTVRKRRNIRSRLFDAAVIGTFFGVLCLSAQDAAATCNGGSPTFTTSFTCTSDTVTTPNPGSGIFTSAATGQAITGDVGGHNISGDGLQLTVTGSDSSFRFTNNGTIASGPLDNNALQLTNAGDIAYLDTGPSHTLSSGVATPSALVLDTTGGSGNIYVGYNVSGDDAGTGHFTGGVDADGVPFRSAADPIAGTITSAGSWGILATAGGTGGVYLDSDANVSNTGGDAFFLSAMGTGNVEGTFGGTNTVISGEIALATADGGDIAASFGGRGATISSQNGSAVFADAADGGSVSVYVTGSGISMSGDPAIDMTSNGGSVAFVDAGHDNTYTGTASGVVGWQYSTTPGTGIGNVMIALAPGDIVNGQGTVAATSGVPDPSISFPGANFSGIGIAAENDLAAGTATTGNVSVTTGDHSSISGAETAANNGANGPAVTLGTITPIYAAGIYGDAYGGTVNVVTGRNSTITVTDNTNTGDIAGIVATGGGTNSSAFTSATPSATCPTGSCSVVADNRADITVNAGNGINNNGIVALNIGEIDNQGPGPTIESQVSTGNIAVTNEHGATIAVTGTGANALNNGILVEAVAGTTTTSLSATNNGTISVTGPNSTGIYGDQTDAGGTGNVALVNNGKITVTDTTGSKSNGLAAFNVGSGNITATNSGTIGTPGYDIYAQANGNGTVTVTNNGTLAGDTSADRPLYGIYAVQSDNSGNAAVGVTSSGPITASVNGINAETNGTGAVTVTTSGHGDITAGEIGIYALSGIATGQVVGGNVMVTTGANVAGVGYGIYAQTGGTGTVTIETAGGTTGVTASNPNGFGVYATAVDGGVTVTVDAENAVGDGASGGIGIEGLTTGTGSVAITNNGTVTGAKDGIYASATDGGNATIVNSGTVDGDAGMHAYSAGGLAEAQNLPGGVIYATGNGIHAWESGGTTQSDGVVVTNGCNGQAFCGGGTGPADIGFNPATANTTIADYFNGSATLTTLSTDFVGKDGIRAGTNGEGMIDVENWGAIGGDDGGIYVRSTGAATGGGVLVSNGLGKGGNEPNALIVAATGDGINVDVASTDFNNVEVDNAGGLSALSDFFELTTTTPATFGGVIAIAGSAVNIDVGGADDVTIYNAGLMLGKGTSADPVIALTTPAASVGNPVAITNDVGAVLGSSTNLLPWIQYAMGNGLAIANGYSYSAAAPASWVEAGNTSKSFVAYYGIDPTGAFANATQDVLLNPSGGPVLLTNSGAMIGRFLLSTSGTQSYTPGATSTAETDNNVIDNENYWATSGESHFYGGGADTLVNEGVIQTAFDPTKDNGTGFLGANGFYTYDTSWDGLNRFYNDSQVSLVNGNAGDELDMGPTPSYSGANTFTYDGYAGGGEFALDAYLTGLPAGTTASCTLHAACADEVVMNTGAGGTVANITGTTYLYINNTAPVGAAGYAPTGISLVYIGTPGNNCNGSPCGPPDTSLIKNGVFQLDPNTPGFTSAYGGGFGPNGGVIQDGAFIYALGERPGISSGFSEPPDTDSVIVLASVPDVIAYQYATLMTAEQNVWQVTANSYMNRMTDLRDSWLGGGWPAPGATKTGLWAVGVGNWTSRDPTVTPPSVGVTLASPLLRAYDTGYDQSTYAILGGFDVGTTFSADSALMGGILGGYVNSSLNYQQGGTTASFTGGTVGAYATYVNGGFFVDALGKADLLTVKFTAPGLSNGLPATAIGGIADAGYRFALAPNWWVEPVLTGQYLDSSIGNLPSVRFKENGSFYGAAGGRVGATLYAGPDYLVQGSLLGRVWDDFGGDNRVAMVSVGGPTLDLGDPFSKLWGEAVAKLDIYAPASNLNGFVSGGVDFNGQWTSVTGKVGLRMSF
jgi:hypothetical protein